MMDERPHPRVSVIIPNYNHGRFLAYAIQSVLDQAFERVEVIVIDDGSTDSSPQVAAGFGNRIRYIRQENQGLSAARNTGLRIAKGAYIGLLDADDMYHPAYLGRMTSLLDNDPEAEAAYCGYQFVDTEGRPLARREQRVVLPEHFYETLAAGNFLVPESMFVRRRCYEQVGFFDETLRACEDWDVWLRIAARFRVVGTDDVLTRHRVLPGSMSSDPQRMIRNRLAVLEKHFGPLTGDSAEWPALKRRAYGRAFLKSAIEHLHLSFSETNDEAYDSLLQMARCDARLLNETNTYYELACAQEEPGGRGSLTTLNLAQSDDVVCGLMIRLLSDEELDATAVESQKRIWRAVHHALGEVAYGAKDYARARRHLVRSLKASQTFAVSRRLIAAIVKGIFQALRFDRGGDPSFFNG